MNTTDATVNQRIRINCPGTGDHGQTGTIRNIRGGNYSIHLDWDQRVHHVVVFFLQDLEPVLEQSTLVH